MRCPRKKRDQDTWWTRQRVGRAKEKKKQMARRRRRNERRANVMKVEGVDHGGSGEHGQAAKAVDRKRKRERIKAKKMTHRSCCWPLGVCRVRRTCRSSGRAPSRVRRVPGSRRRISWPSFYRGYRIREKRS